MGAEDYSDPEAVKMLNIICIRKALKSSSRFSINKHSLDLECLVSRWSTNSHTFVAASGEYGPTLEVVLDGAKQIKFFE